MVKSDSFDDKETSTASPTLYPTVGSPVPSESGRDASCKHRDNLDHPGSRPAGPDASN